MTELTEELIADLQSIDTPTACNALEVVAPERRGYGYTTQPLLCTRPELPPLVGVARTATIRSAHPNHRQGKEAGKISVGYYTYIDEGPKPSVAVIQDLDGAQRGYGSYWGEVNSNVHKGLGCLGVITDGSVRDVPDAAEGFQFMADRVGPSHAFVHVVGYGESVNVAGMRVSSGDLIHADQHGAVTIPWEVANDVLGAAKRIAAEEAVIINASREPGFNMERLKRAWGESAELKH